MPTSDPTSSLLWKLERLETLLTQQKDLPSWLEAIWWAADLFHGGQASYAHHLLGRLRSPPRQQTHAPCPCQRWTHWLHHVPADPEERAGFMARLAHQVSRTPLTAPPASAMTWVGCPVRAWLHERRGLTQRPVIPLRCAQRLEMQEGGYLPTSSQNTSGDFYLAYSEQGWHLSARAGAMVRGARQTHTGAWLLRDGDSLWLNSLEYLFQTTPADILCLHEPSQSCRWLPLSEQEISLGPDAEQAPGARRWAASAHQGLLRLRPEDPQQPSLHLPIATAAADQIERAQLGQLTAWAERWPQRDPSAQDARWRPPARPQPTPEPARPLEELRQRLYPDHPQARLPRELFSLRLQAWSSGCGPVADAYLIDHLPHWPAPWSQPACHCGDWSRWLEALPQDPQEQERWLGALYAEAPRRGLPCAQPARLLGPLPDYATEPIPQQLPLCGELHLKRDEQGLLQRCPPQEAHLLLRPQGQGWSLEPLAPDVVSPQGARPGHPLALRAGQIFHLGSQRWQVAGELLGALRIEHAWGQGAPPLHHPLFGRTIHIGRRGHTEDEAIQQCIRLPAPSVSRVHCLLEYMQGRFLVRDQHSTGGTYLNGRKLTGAALLRAQRDTLQVGDFQLTLVEARPCACPSGADQREPL